MGVAKWLDSKHIGSVYTANTCAPRVQERLSTASVSITRWQQANVLTTTTASAGATECRVALTMLSLKNTRNHVIEALDNSIGAAMVILELAGALAVVSAIAAIINRRREAREERLFAELILGLENSDEASDHN